MCVCSSLSIGHHFLRKAGSNTHTHTHSVTLQSLPLLPNAAQQAAHTGLKQAYEGEFQQPGAMRVHKCVRMYVCVSVCVGW